MDTTPPSIGGSMDASVTCSECQRSFALDQVIRLGNGYVCGHCKGLALQKLSEGVAGNEFERIRQSHIKHEASVRSVGFLYFMTAAFWVLWGLVAILDGSTIAVLFGICFWGIAGILIGVGIALRRLKSWARIPTAIFSVLGLLFIPIGTFINGYVLYLIFSKKGQTVFSADYKRVIAETPHIKYRMSIVIWLLLGLLLVVVGVAVLGWFFSIMRVTD